MGNELVPQRQASNALKVYDKIGDPLQFARELAPSFASIMAAPVDQGMAIALTALCEGLTPVDMRKRYHWIQGRPVMQAAAMLSEFRLNHGGDFIVEVDSSEESKIVFVDNQGRKYIRSLTWKECEESRWPWVNWKDHSRGLKDNWSTALDRKAMIFARNVSDSLKKICPELAAGVYTPEEMGDVFDVQAMGVKVSDPPVDLKNLKWSLPEENGEIIGEIVPETPKKEVDAVAKADGSRTFVGEVVGERHPITEATKHEIIRLTTLLKLTEAQFKKSLTARKVSSIDDLSEADGQGMCKRMAERLDSLEKKSN